MYRIDGMWLGYGFRPIWKSGMQIQQADKSQIERNVSSEFHY